jgi:tRNA-2-methylthio-N6-dimethylallyladenosine synthase
MKGKRFYIETFGCQMNEHDSEKIAGVLAHRGMIQSGSIDDADLFILNTCSVREKAAQKVYSRLGEVRARKRRRRDLIIGVVGCVAQQEREALAHKAPFVDLVVGTHLYHTIPDLLDQIEAGRTERPATTRVAAGFLPQPAPVEVSSILRNNSFRASVTIMEGCNKRCSFCVVPQTRGSERRRPAHAILDEVEQAVERGFVEVLLLGQTVNSYRDPEQPRTRFADLLSRVAGVPGIRRVRFTSPHPRRFDDATIRVIGECEPICDQVHLPVQSGANRVLRHMRRQHTREWYLGLAERLQNCGRSVRLSTDVIVGFPGETDQDFEETLSLVRQVEFESMFSFKYSPRPGTEAAGWIDDVPEAEKSRRLAALQALQRDIQIKLHRERYLGRAFEVLVEGRSRDGEHWFGRTTSNKIVNFAGSEPPGAFVNVVITQIGPNSLVGEKVPAGAH